jgi:putative ABC transport system permease protein
VNSDGRTDLAYMDDPAMSFWGFELMDGEYANQQRYCP